MNNDSGFTLLEVLIYSAILAIFLGAAFAFISSILGTTDSLLERNEVLASQELIERKIDWLAAYALSVTAPATNTSSTAGFTITTASPTLNPVQFSKSGGVIALSVGGGATTSLTNDRVGVTDFLAEYIVSSTLPSILKVYFALESKIYKNIISSTTIIYVLE